MLNFLNLNEQAFGLDISDLSLKVVKLRRKGKFFDLDFFNESKIKPGIIRKGEVKKEDQLAEIIKKTIKENGGGKNKTKNAVISLPEEKSFLQVIQMPHLSEEDLRSAVVFEAENHIPLPIDQVYLDYQIVHPLYSHLSEQGKDGQKMKAGTGSRERDFHQLDHLDVLIAAFPRKIIDSYLSCFEKAEIKPLTLEVESLAISRAIVKNEVASRPVLLIDFGANRSIFIIFAGRSVMFTFSIPVSSQSFTEAISRAMKIDLTEAEKLKEKYGIKGKFVKTGKEIFEALIPPLTDLTEQIKKYLEYYQTHDFHEHLIPGPKKIEKILICGGGSKLKGLATFLSSQLKISVEIGNPWINILSSDLQPKEQMLIYEKEKSLGYTTALGLALRGIKNCLPDNRH